MSKLHSEACGYVEIVWDSKGVRGAERTDLE
jgi:hypothetical protein